MPVLTAGKHLDFFLRKWETIWFWGYLLLTPHKTCHGVACFCIRWNCVLSHALTLFKSLNLFIFGPICWSLLIFPGTLPEITPGLTCPFEAPCGTWRVGCRSHWRRSAHHTSRGLRGPSGGPWERWQLRRFCALRTQRLVHPITVLSQQTRLKWVILWLICYHVGLLLHL